MNSLPFTGERYIPGQGGARIAYEHLHRYLFARQWAKDKVVFDVATGSGYGAELLASVARCVCAVELDWNALAHARRANLRAANLFFVQGDATRLPLLTASADLVVATEILEHVAEQEELVCELARVVRPDGAVLISTPNKASYSDARNYRNPFHVHELYRDEFAQLIGRHFAHVQLMEQHVRAGSLVFAETGHGGEVIGEPIQGRAPTEALYLLALCNHGDKLEGCVPGQSAYLDTSDALQQEWQDEVARLNTEIEALGRWGRLLEEQVREKDKAIDTLQQEKTTEIAERDARIRGLQHEMETEIARREGALEHLKQEFEERTRWAMDLQEEVKNRDERIVEANALLDEREREIRRLGDELVRIRHAFVYRVLRRLRVLPH